MGKKELERQKELYKDNPSKREKKSKLWKEKQRKLEEDIREQISRRKPVEPVDDPFVIQCLFCSKSYTYTSILKHIGKNDLCKAFYGPKYEKMKKRHARIRKQLYREEHGTEKELEQKREKYNSDSKLREKNKNSTR